MDVEITDDLFHVSFGIIRQLGKDLLWHYGANRTTQTHQYTLLREGGLVPFSWLGDYRYRLVLR